MATDLRFLDDARWNPERDCVEVTAEVSNEAGVWQTTCVITEDALGALVRLSGTADPVRVFHDVEPRLARAAARVARTPIPEIALTRREIVTAPR